MATQLVRNVVKDSGQNPIANSQVRIYLVAGPAGAALDAGAEASIGTPHVPSTSRAGYWAASLQPNAGAGAITNPTGTYYRVVEPSGATWTIQLNGDVAPPVDGWWVGDPAILVQDPVSPPPVVAGVTSAQLTAAADGAQAAAVATAATDATTKANAAQANAQSFTTAQLGNYVPQATATAKGDLLAATAAGALARLGVGADAAVLLADSTQTAGLRWGTSQETVARALGWLIITDPSFGVSTGTSSTQTAAIKAALDANPGRAFWFGYGDYRLDTTLSITQNNSIHLAPGARIYAAAAMATLVDYDNGLSVSNYAEDKFLTGHGTLDCALLANKALTIGSVLRFSLGDGLTIIDPINRGLVTKTAGAEIVARDIRFKNTGTTNSHKSISVTTTNGSTAITSSAAFATADGGYNGAPIFGAGIPVGATATFTDASNGVLSLPATASATVTATILTNIAIEANMGDCVFTDVQARDFTCGIWDRVGNVWNDVHPWIGTTTQLTTRYPVSVGFLLCANSVLKNPYADTYRYSFRTAAPSGFAKVRLHQPRVFCNTGNLTDALAAASPGVVFDLQDAAQLIARDGIYQGHGTTHHAFTSGSTIRLTVPTYVDAVPGTVTGLAEFKRGVQMGVTSFAASVFGSTSGSATLTTNSCQMIVGDGVVEWRFVLIGTIPGTGWAGKLRIGLSAFPSGATATASPFGPLAYLSSSVSPSTFANVTAVIASGLASPGTTVVQLNTIGAGTQSEPDTTAIGGATVQIWGRITTTFTYPS